MKKLLALLFAVFALCALTLTTRPAEGRAPGKLRRVAGSVPGRYIVVLNEDVPGASVEAVAHHLASAHGGEISHVYTHALKGFAVRLPEMAAAALARNPQVAYVEEEGVGTISGSQPNPGWGLDRIDQRDRPVDGFFNYNYTGSNIKIYILDTGVRVTHQDFGGRASVGYDAFGGNGLDVNGHGTAVASLAGGTSYGSAKQANIISVRVCDNGGSCPYSAIIAGVDWVTSNHSSLPAVANMSLGGPASSSLDYAVQRSINSNVVYVVGAGNANTDASNTSPAHVGAAITVGATDVFDTRAVFNSSEASNYGYVLDLFAPGKEVPAAYFGDDTSMVLFGGTSAASPYVAGVAAQYRQAQSDRWFIYPTDVHNEIVRNATFGRVSDPGPGSPNALVYSAFDMRQCPYAGGCSSPDAGCQAAYCRAVGYVWSNCQCTYPRYY
ncbi:MAG TPA: S8 family peptidase [Pyrinomonadaceae bacterium]|jgi:subtilisin family serine protease